MTLPVTSIVASDASRSSGIGDEEVAAERGLGHGTPVFEPYLAAGTLGGDKAQAKVELPADSGEAERALRVPITERAEHGTTGVGYLLWEYLEPVRPRR